MQKFRKLPIGIQSFEDLRKNNYLYVDKTEFVFTLVETGKVYFLSRPRRFGKSLFLSTLKAFFEGKKELFTGLKIVELEKDNPDAWKKYPVVYINFAQDNFSEEGSLEECIDKQLSAYEEKYSIKEKAARFAGRFMDIVQAAHKKTGLPAAVLVDEYDKPLLDAQNDDTLTEHNRNVLKGLYITLKALDDDTKFVFLTGVTKFSKVSVFSDLNQLEDISLAEDYATVCGITEQEMLETFGEEIKQLAQKNGLSEQECIKRLEQMYDGYHFFPESEGVYNPFSLINCLKRKNFDSYWFSTGTPEFLIKKLRSSRLNYMDFTNGVEATELELKDYRNDNPNPIPLFYQTGYLTIKGYNSKYRIYTLKYPNDEVKFAFLNSLLPSFFPAQSNSGLDIVSFSLDIEKGDAEGMMSRFKSLFASLPYPAADEDGARRIAEQNFQNVFYLVFTLLGQWSQVEVHNYKGRADCVLVSGDTVFIFEFKVDGSAEDALKQIEENRYDEKYKASGNKIVKIAASFSTQERNITECKIVQQKRDS